MGSSNNNLRRLWVSEKKKVIAAFCLILIMIFMWIRILTGGGPEKTEASVKNDRKPDDKKDVKIEFIELPEIEGRNDAVLQDYFAISGSLFRKRTNTEIIAENKQDTGLKKLTGYLVLDAIEHGENPKAFINNSLCSEGDILNVKMGDSAYRLKVEKIGLNKVVLKYSGTEIVLRLR